MSASEIKLESLADRLRWAREQVGLSQAQVAKALDLHRPTITQIETGVRCVKAEEISKFAELFQVKEEWLIKGESALSLKSDPKIQLAARELSKLKSHDLDVILKLIQVIKTQRETKDE